MKTPRERENCLAKCREAWKKKTAEVKGKQKEYQSLQGTERGCRKHQGKRNSVGKTKRSGKKGLPKQKVREKSIKESIM